MAPSTALLVLIGVIVIGYVSAGLIWQWWDGYVDEPADRTRGHDFQKGFRDE